MIDVKRAVGVALAYTKDFGDLFPSSDARLEETELVENRGRSFWAITLSFTENQVIGTRSYKLFLIDAETGEVQSMKTRNVLSSAISSGRGST
jgi:hypothetical protein